MNNETEDTKKENFIERSIKTYVLRAGHFTNSEKNAYEKLHDKYCIDFSETPLDFESVFGNKNPTVIEIGFGMGKATAIIAQNNPDINYIGIEVHKPGVGKLLASIEELKLSNIRIIEYDAMEVLKKQIKDDSVSAFHIFFADPWPKKRHHKRRLVQRPRTDLMTSKLVKGGYLYFVTDWLPYAEFALDELNQTAGLKNKFDGFAPHQEWRPETRFEQKGLDANRVISELMFTRV
ncbi:MAG: tRNA (guanosine(46)-N7)-methyltransferase TrmB [Treponema sp.]|nr:tRNA (guanosine(46)-N7)-methyltransferase TrmB [Treponema sp.]MBR0487428.1 tRNA (guanosine(46)-N7)-methyltransferase TrmB [Treponema sp.]